MQDLPPASLGLRRAKLFSGLGPTEIEGIARECGWRRFTAGQTISARGQPDRGVYFIVAGRVRVTSYTASGKQVTLRDLGEGDSVGVIAAIDGSARAADVVALTDVLVAVVSPVAFRELVAREPSVARNLVPHLAKLIRHLSDRVMELSTLGVQNRIHAELLRLAHEHDGAAPGPQRLLSPAPRHADIAARVSTTREQVTRELSELAKRGLLAKHAKGVLITDLDALKRIVEDARLEL